MKTAIAAMILVTAIASPANADYRCWQYSLSGEYHESGTWTCNKNDKVTEGDAIAREAQRKNNLSRSYQSTTTNVGSDGTKSTTTTITTIPYR